jgi:hypothetical protein
LDCARTQLHQLAFMLTCCSISRDLYRKVCHVQGFGAENTKILLRKRSPHEYVRVLLENSDLMHENPRLIERVAQRVSGWRPAVSVSDVSEICRQIEDERKAIQEAPFRNLADEGHIYSALPASEPWTTWDRLVQSAGCNVAEEDAGQIITWNQCSICDEIRLAYQTVFEGDATRRPLKSTDFEFLKNTRQWAEGRSDERIFVPALNGGRICRRSCRRFFRWFEGTTTPPPLRCAH